MGPVPEVLAGFLLVRVALPVMHRDVVEACIAGDMLESLFLRNRTTGFADDHGQLVVSIKALREHRLENRGSLATAIATALVLWGLWVWKG